MWECDIRESYLLILKDSPLRVCPQMGGIRNALDEYHGPPGFYTEGCKMSFTIEENHKPEAASTAGRSGESAEQSVVVAAEYKLNAETMAYSLSAWGGFGKVAAVDSLKDLLNLIRTQRPKLVLMSERLVTQGLREVLSELAVRLGETRIAVFADELTDRQLDLVVSNRVTAILSRREPIRALTEHLGRALTGAKLVSPLLSDRIQIARNGDFHCAASVHLKRLTDRQWDVLLRIAEGRRVSEVAHDLDISSKAVESHKYRIMKTVGATDRVELCRWAIREGLITP